MRSLVTLTTFSEVAYLYDKLFLQLAVMEFDFGGVLEFRPLLNGLEVVKV